MKTNNQTASKKNIIFLLLLLLLLGMGIVYRFNVTIQEQVEADQPIETFTPR
ncbi:MAG: hypothetical protein H0V66_06325 [Bdellovibrionales bacterium]|nr:hypothetical protein [Bdellovibrionales bacterium]